MVLLTLCRFDLSGKLILSLKETDQTAFVAVSHVWGDVTWENMPDIGRAIPVSPHKLRFISQRLPRLVKGYHFWMDILAVDQSSEEARIQVVTQIPQIYREAKFTIVIRDHGGICSGCFEAMTALNVSEHGSDTPEEMTLFRAAMDNYTALDQHMRDHHPQGFQEPWMERNWPLQELLLSNTVKFTVCGQSNEQALMDGPRREGLLPSSVDTIKARTTILDLMSLGQTWVGSSGSPSDATESGQEADLLEAFLEAFGENGTVTRPSTQEWNPNLAHQMRSSTNSTRKSGKARDYILAVLPQFAWYRLPANVRSMSFGRIYEDAMLQIGEGHFPQDETPSRSYEIRPKFTRGMLGGLSIDSRSSFQPSPEIPSPECLGDVCKLMCFADDPATRQTSPELDPILLQPVHPEDSIAYLLGLVADTIWFTQLDSKADWFYQFAMWKDNVPQLLSLIGNMNLSGANESEPSSDATKALQSLAVVELITEIFRLLATHSNSLELTAFSEISQNLLSNTQNANSQRILRESASLSQDWTKATNLFTRADTPAFRNLLLTMTTALCCGFGMNTLPWLSENLQVYLLMAHNVATGDILQSLVFGAKNLNLENLDGVHALGAGIEPYIAIDADEGGSRNVIGLAPKAGNWSLNPCRPDHD